MTRSAIGLATLALLGAAGPLPGQGAAADPDIFLVTLDLRGRGTVVGAPANITARRGYDNQPGFTADGRAILYTSTREDAQADIWRYDIAGGRATRVTVTAPESEYSAAVIPGSQDIAMIRVERDSTQRLWRMPMARAGRKGELGRLAIPQVKPAGYFAFADSSTVVCFVLGRPNTLQVAHLTTGRVDTVAVNVGRSIHRIPGTRRISYVSKMYDEKWWLLSLDPDDGHVIPLTLMPKGVEDYAWLPDGRLIAGVGATLVVADPTTDATWRQVADFSASGLRAITRLAVSAQGTHLAFVAEPGAPGPGPR